MPRRKPGTMFDAPAEESAGGSRAPEEENLIDENERATGEATPESNGPGEVAPPPAIGGKKKKKSRDPSPLDDDLSLRERVRERASRRQFHRIAFYERIVNGQKRVGGKWVPYEYPPQIIMEAAKRLDEMSIDKTATAQPLASSRRRLLLGRVASSSDRSPAGFRTGGDSVMPALPDNPLAEHG